MVNKNLFVFNKLDYAKGIRPDVDCILCAVKDKDKRVKDLELFRDELFFMCLNLYPYNPAHIMVVPLRHVTDIRDLNDIEEKRMFYWIKKCMNILDEVYQPHGYNVGINIGDCSGASISHLHYHIVPRYPKEIGFMDIIGNSRIIVESPEETFKKLKVFFDSI